MPTLKKFSITGAAGNLEGIAHLPDEAPRAIAVVAHPLPTMGGTMDNKVVTTLAKTFVELGFVALRFNFRGVGDSAGEFDSGNGEVEDVLAIVRHAQQEYGDLPLILSGFSFGGYVQARAAQHLHPHPHRLVLIAPAVGHDSRMPPCGTTRCWCTANWTRSSRWPMCWTGRVRCTCPSWCCRRRGIFSTGG